MKQQIRSAVRQATTLPQVRDQLLALLAATAADNPSHRIGYVSGIISSDGPAQIPANIARLASYAEQLRDRHPFPIFSPTDVFNAELFSQLVEMRLAEDERSTHFLRFWRDILTAGYVTDIFMTPRWDESVGAKDELATAKQQGLAIHFVD